MINELLVILSEVTLSLYPSLIKLVNVSTALQTGIRMAVFTILGLICAVATKTPFTWSQFLTIESPLTGLLNLVHVGSSYTAFEALAGGNAMSLFYLYPFFNLIGATLILGETLPIASIPWMLFAFFGAVLIAQPTPSNWSIYGVAAALLAALTETCIYLWFKQTDTKATKATNAGKTEITDKSPWVKMTQMYGSSFLLFVVGAAILVGTQWIKPGLFASSTSNILSMILFNSLIGFTGYALRFYLIPNVSTVVFSTLSFFGVISAYLFGWLFSAETPTLMQGLGAAAIIAANTVLLRKEIV